MDDGGERGIRPAKALAGAAALVVLTALVTYGATVWAGAPSGSQAATLRLLARQPAWGRFLQAINLVRRQYIQPPDLNAMLAGATRGAVAALGDPYSGYFDESAFRESRIQTTGEYAGIGVSVDERDGYSVVIGVFPGTPAADTAFVGAGQGEPVGLRPGDRLATADGKSLIGLPGSAVAQVIRGAPGSPLTLGVLRQQPGGATRALTFRMTRRRIVIPTATGHMLPGGIGYLHLSGFTQQTPAQVRGVLAALRRDGMSALVLDLRNNPGGLLQAATAVAGDFLPPGVVTYLVDRAGHRTNYDAARGTPVGVPYVVLVNGYTASAAELLAGAIQDDGRALLVGTRTFGKGVVQRIFPLGGGTGLKLTVARYYTPKGHSVNGNGIMPNIVVANPPGASPDVLGDPARDPQLARALAVLRQRAAA